MKRFLAGVLGLLACSSDVASSSSRIVGGDADTTTTAVVMVYIHAQSQNGWGDCTGTVISPHVVLTAAHCLDPTLLGLGTDPIFQIYVGNDIYSKPPATDFFDVQATVIDPAFLPQAIASKGHDVGVVVTKDALPIQPIAFAHDAFDDSIVGKTVTLVGYGETDPADASSDGVRHSATTTIAQLDDHELITANQLPSGCEGDSGGPVLMATDGGNVVVGVISHGITLQDCAGSSITERVDIEDEFLDPIVAQYDPPPPPVDAGVPVTPPSSSSCNASGGSTSWPLALFWLFAQRRRRAA